MPEQSPQLVVTRRASTDIRKVYRYSFAEWGEERAESYAAQLWDSIHVQFANPELGAFRSGVQSGLRSHVVGRHLIWYRYRPNRITIIRVLHHRQRPGRDLTGI